VLENAHGIHILGVFGEVERSVALARLGVNIGPKGVEKFDGRVLILMGSLVHGSPTILVGSVDGCSEGMQEPDGRVSALACSPVHRRVSHVRGLVHISAQGLE